MRKLKTDDIPAFCRCLKNIGIKDQIREIAQQANTVTDAWGKGFDMLWNIFDLVTEESGEKELYKFLARPFEMSPEEVENLPIDDLFNMVKKFAAENNLTGFFKSAAALMK